MTVPACRISVDGFTRASHLQPGQQLQRHALGIWHTIISVYIAGGEVIAATRLGLIFRYAESDMVDVSPHGTESDQP
jgi:hypothetical protein